MKSTEASATNSIWGREAGDSEEQVSELGNGFSIYRAHMGPINGEVEGQSRTREQVQRWRARIDMIHLCNMNKLV